MIKEIRNIKQFLEIYPDEERKYKMGFGFKYKGRFINDIPTDYFDWAVDAYNKDLERNEMEKVFEGLTIADCLMLNELAIATSDNIAIKVPEELLRKLNKYAREHKTNRSAVIVKELKKLLEKI